MAQVMLDRFRALNEQRSIAAAQARVSDIAAQQAAHMAEQVFTPVVRLYEAEALLRVPPFHYSHRHCSRVLP